MLTRFHKILIAVLAVQIVLALVMLTRGNDTAALRSHPVLAGFVPADVTRLQVFAAADKPAVDLVKRDGHWVIASSFDYPVDAARIDEVTAALGKMAAAAPIATQAARHAQLKVADTEFERKLVITAGGKDVTLYVGGAAGMQRNAVRLAGDDRVYAVSGVSAFSLPAEARSWALPEYVKVARDDIASVTIEHGATIAKLDKAADKWNVTLDGAPIALAKGETLDDQTIGRLADSASTLRLSAPADPKRDTSAKVATITIEKKASGTSSAAPIVIDVLADPAGYYVHQRALDHAAIVDKPDLDEVVGVARDKIVKPPPPPTTPPAGAGSGSAVPRPLH